MAELLTAIAVLFIIAAPFLLIANRFGLPAAPLLIASGILAGFFIDEDLVLELAQFGIALLVFAFGVEIRLSTIGAVLRDSELAAIAQVVVVGSLGTGFGLVVGVPLEDAIFLGIAAALSSTIVATSLMKMEIYTDLVRGRIAQSIHFIQDLLAVGIVLIIGAEAWAVDPVILQIGYGVVFLGGAFLVNRYVFDLLGRIAGGSTELMIIGVTSLLALFIGAATAAGVPIVVGAFAAGLAVRHDPVSYLGLYNGLESIKDFFVAIFFATVGALVLVPFVEATTAESIEKLLLVAGLVVLTLVIKPIVTTVILLYRGHESRTAALTGLSTDQVSEFALIIAIEALLLGLLTQAVFDAIILAAAVTMAASTFTYTRSEAIYQAIAARIDLPGRHDWIDAHSQVPGDLTDHVIVLGYDQKGTLLCRRIEALGHPYLVIENDPERYDAVRRECDSYVLGDAMEPYTWEKARVEDATVVVSLTNSPVVSERLVDADLDAELIVRARTKRKALEYLDAGAGYAIVSDLLAGEQLTKLLRDVLEGDLSHDELRAAGTETLEWAQNEGR